VAINAQGKIVVAGGSGFGSRKERFALARYDADGSLDPTFGGDGKVRTDLALGPDVAFAVALPTNGKIVVAGGCSLGERNPKWALTRYNQNGSLDPGFSGDGKVITGFTSYDDGAYGLRIQADGKLVAAGLAGFDVSEGSFALARYNANGSLDASLGGDGKVITDFAKGYDSAYTVAIQANGKIVAAGRARRSDTNFALVRYLPG
jgi:uncharacterized delta-60 repeat protein